MGSSPASGKEVGGSVGALEELLDKLEADAAVAAGDQDAPGGHGEDCRTRESRSAEWLSGDVHVVHVNPLSVRWWIRFRGAKI